MENTNNLEKVEYENFYFSRKAYECDLKSRYQFIGDSRPTLTKVNDLDYTIVCKDRHIESMEGYRRIYPDTVLVARLPVGEGKITIIK